MVRKEEDNVEAPRRTEDAGERPVLVPARGRRIVEIETKAHEEHRRQLRLREAGRRQLQQSTSAVSPARGSGTYKITYKYLTDLPNGALPSFNYAAERIGKLLTTKLSIVNVPANLECDLARGEPLPSTLEDMFIFVRIKAIDGVGKVLGQASPCLEDNNKFPRVGYIEFDSSDVIQMVSDKTFDAVVVHETMHIIGLGTLWQSKNLVRGTTDPRYHGQFGVDALSSINGAYMGTPAVQDTGGEGTALSHWRESVFDDEMMTGFLSATYQPVSLMTIESFRDLGYTVDSSAADAYVTQKLDLENIPINSNGQGSSAPGNGENQLPVEAIVGIIGGGVVILLALLMVYFRARPLPARTNNTPSPFSSVPPNSLPVRSATVPGGGVLPTAVSVAGATGNATPAVLVDMQTLMQDPVWQVNAYEFQEITRVTDMSLVSQYLVEANGDVTRAVDNYFAQNH